MPSIAYFIVLHVKKSIRQFTLRRGTGKLPGDDWNAG
jgi:hypothetical protein